MIYTDNLEKTILYEPATKCNRLQIISGFTDSERISTHVIELVDGYKEGRYKPERQNGDVHSFNIEYGGSEEYFEDLTHCLCVDDGKDIITEGGDPKVYAECFVDTNDGHSDSEVFATRGQAVQMLWEYAGEPNYGSTSRFTDVANSGYEEAIAWAESWNICFGYPSICADTFCPNELITREDFGLMAHRLALYEQFGTAFDYGRTDWFKDFYSIDYYGWGGFTWAVQFGVVNVPEGSEYCYPHGRITMDELEAGVYRIFHLDEAANYSAIVNGNGTDDEPANWASLCIRPIVSVIPYDAGPAPILSG